VKVHVYTDIETPVRPRLPREKFSPAAWQGRMLTMIESVA
jgi:hypothetical protein